MSESSTHPGVTAAVEKLDRIGDLPASEHVELYEEVHRALQDALADAAGEPSGQQGGVASGSRQTEDAGAVPSAGAVDVTSLGEGTRAENSIGDVVPRATR